MCGRYVMSKATWDLALLLAPETLQPVMAREVSRGDLEAIKARKSSLFIRDFRTAGVDVLDRASETWAAVGRHG